VRPAPTAAYLHDLIARALAIRAFSYAALEALRMKPTVVSADVLFEDFRGH
jgi:hypothetical protein